MSRMGISKKPEPEVKVQNLGEVCSPPASEQLPDEEQWYVISVGPQRVVRVQQNPTWAEGGRVI